MTNNAKKKAFNGMGTFLGVYLPCSQSILSVVLFLRMAYIIGEAGIIQSFIMLFGCALTTFLTVLSMNAIITNGKIKSGGVYFLASRSLGPSTGGAIGILYYLATAFSTSMAILGFVETFILSSHLILGNEAFSMRFYSLIILILIIVINLFSLRIVSRTNLMIIILVFISILAMLAGLLSSKRRGEELNKTVPGLTGLSKENINSNWLPDYTSA